MIENLVKENDLLSNQNIKLSENDFKKREA